MSTHRKIVKPNNSLPTMPNMNTTKPTLAIFQKTNTQNGNFIYEP